MKSFQDRVGIDFQTATIKSPDARNAGRPASDFSDVVASGLEGILDVLKAQMGTSKRSVQGSSHSPPGKDRAP